MMTAPYTITLVWWLNYCYTWTVSATTITSRTSTMLVLYAYTIHSNRMQWQSRGFIGFGQAFHHCIKPHICNAKLTNIVLLPLRVHQCSIICRSPASGRLHTTQTAPEPHWETSVPHIPNETLFQILVPSLGCAPWSLASASRIVDKIMHSINLVTRALTFRQHRSLSVSRASATHDTNPRTSPVWGSGRERVWTANPCDSSTDDTAVLSTHICNNSTSRTLQIP